jgi:hypothetical protein
VLQGVVVVAGAGSTVLPVQAVQVVAVLEYPVTQQVLLVGLIWVPVAVAVMRRVVPVHLVS